MSRLFEIKAVIFDFDGTLAILNIDFHVMKTRVLDLIKSLGVDETSIRETYLLEIIDEVYSIVREKELSRAEEFYKKSHAILHGAEIKAAEKGGLMPGVREMLRLLMERGIKVGIITRNCEEAVRKVFPEIDAFCHVFVSREAVRRVKPHPDHLSAALRVLNVSAEESVMVGDHTIDILTGKQVGMKTIGVLTGRIRRNEFQDVGADYVLKDATEILSLIGN